MLKVKLEIFRPYRKTIDTYKYGELATMDVITQKVNDDIKANLPAIIQAYPDAEELRWEYEGIGQGHYVMIKFPTVVCGECNTRVETSNAMVQSGEYGSRDIVVCTDCYGKQ